MTPTKAQTIVDQAAARGIVATLTEHKIPARPGKYDLNDGSSVIVSDVPDGIRVRIGSTTKRRPTPEPGQRAIEIRARVVPGSVTLHAVTEHGAQSLCGVDQSILESIENGHPRRGVSHCRACMSNLGRLAESGHFAGRIA